MFLVGHVSSELAFNLERFSGRHLNACEGVICLYMVCGLCCVAVHHSPKNQTFDIYGFVLPCGNLSGLEIQSTIEKNILLSFVAFDKIVQKFLFAMLIDL